MTLKQFDKLANELFDAVLTPLGFKNEGSLHCTFHRRISADVYHVILPDPGSRVAWFDVKVFPTSPAIEPGFASMFPDELGLPTDSWSYLSARGVGLDHEQFNSKSEENLRRRFELTVKPLLLTQAIPYLDGIRTVADMIPLLKHSSYLGLALHHVGRVVEAKAPLLKERDRLQQLDVENKRVATLLARINELLNVRL
jgi:hypothetical protein